MINEYYLDDKVLEDIKSSFNKNKFKSARLDGFFSDIIYSEIKDEIRRIKFEHFIIPDRFSFWEGKINNKLKDIFTSENFLDFVEKIIKKKVNNLELEIRKFKHRNYTLIHDSETKKDFGFQFFFFVCSDWSFNYGGNKVFVTKKGGGESFVFTPKGNSFVLVDKRKDCLDFVQYVKHFAGRKEFIIIEGKIL